MLPGDLIFIRGQGLVIEPIKWMTNSKYSHDVGYIRDNLFIGVQGFQKTQYEVLSRYKGQSDVFTCDLLTFEQREKIVAFAQSELGSRYDHLLLVWEALRLLFGIFLPYYKNKRRICSTLWADAYRSVGIDLSPGIKYPTPADMVKSSLLRQVGSF